MPADPAGRDRPVLTSPQRLGLLLLGAALVLAVVLRLSGLL